MTPDSMNHKNHHEFCTSLFFHELVGRIAQSISLRAYIINPGTLLLFSFSGLPLDDYKLRPASSILNIQSERETS